MGAELFVPDMITLLTAYVFFAYGRVGSGIFAVTQGIFIDIFSGGMRGLFTFLFVSVYGTVWLGSRFFDLQSPKGQIIVVFFAMLLKAILFVVLVSTVSEHVSFSNSFLWGLGMLAILTALVSPVLVLILDRIRSAILEDMGKGLTGR